MILKPFEPYPMTAALTALTKRLHPSHEMYSKLQVELNRQEAGEHGEQHVFSLLATSQLPDQTYLLHNVGLKSKVETQIDILVLSPWWCLILEVKNIKGKLYFNDNPRQLIRKGDDGGKDEILGSPEIQVEQYTFGLKSFLESHGVKLPIYGAILFPFNNAIIEKPPEKILLLIGREVVRFIWSLPRSSGVNVDSRKLGELLMKSLYTRDPFPLCHYYKISPSMISSGVECPHCGTIPMQRALRTWKCPKCEKTSMDAHRKALADYSMLINKQISNSECVSYLRLKNHQQAHRILAKCSSSRTGKSRNSVYHLSYNLLLKGESNPGGTK
ncbi:nuclease-related domain-containing protein [Ureibacillus composti]|nr:nuclease-related domain-containing protein [Ureibacillus composti]